MSILSKTFIDHLEREILSGAILGKENEFMPSFSIRDSNSILPNYEIIKKSPINSYLQIASNCMGMTTYGFYKANDEKIYIIVAFINEITKIYNSKDFKLN